MIDLPRAPVLAEHTSVHDEPDARRIVEQVLADAGELTTGQLRRRVDMLVVAAEPEAIAARRDGDGRTLDQLRADTVLGLLDGSLTGAPGTRRGNVDLVVPLATLTALSDQPGEILGWGPVLADIARKTAAYQPDAVWRFRVLDDTGRLVAAGTTRRRPTTEQERFVRARDRTCRAPGCRIPAARCEIDHTIAYADGGPTVTGNLGALCTFHHRANHEAGWQLRQTQPGVFEWRSPLGRRYVLPTPDD